MRRQLTNPSLGAIALAGIVLGLLAWAFLGSGSPFEPAATPAPTAASTPQPTATEEIWPLPTLPVFNWSQSPLSDSQALVGEPAPDFELKDQDGALIRLSDFAGRVVVVNFWASWCPPCREEMPALQALADEYADKGLTVLGVNTAYADSREDALQFMRELGLTFPVVFDESGAVTERIYGVFGLPVTFWVTPEGTIHTIKVGPATREDLFQLADQLLTP